MDSCEEGRSFLPGNSSIFTLSHDAPSRPFLGAFWVHRVFVSILLGMVRSFEPLFSVFKS